MVSGCQNVSGLNAKCWKTRLSFYLIVKVTKYFSDIFVINMTGLFRLRDCFFDVLSCSISFSWKAFNTIKFWYLNKEIADTQKVNKNGLVKPSPISTLKEPRHLSFNLQKLKMLNKDSILCEYRMDSTTLDKCIQSEVWHIINY